MAGLPEGYYRVSVDYDSTQCDISCDKSYSNGTITSAVFSAYSVPTVTYTFTPKTGYEIGNISVLTSQCTYEIIDGNKVKITPNGKVTDGVASGEVEITITTEEVIQYLQTLFTKIADAIRTLDGTTALIPANKFPSRIQAFLDSPQLLAKLLGISLTLGENTWEQIDIASRLKIADKLWNIGDEIDVLIGNPISTYASVPDDGSGSQVIASQIVTFQIYDFNHDPLSHGDGNAGITFGMKNLLAETFPMNTSNTNVGSFKDSYLNMMLQQADGSIITLLPSDLQAVIKPVNKKTSAGNKSTTINTDSMKLFLFSAVETGLYTTSAVYKDEGTKYPIFTDSASRIKRLNNGAGSAIGWWERSPSISASSNFCFVTSSAGISNHTASISKGVCFGFCV